MNAERVLTVVALAAVAVFARAPLPDRTQPPVQTLDIQAGDFFYRTADTIAAGPVRIRLSNVGREFHHAQLVRFDSSHTLEDVMRAMERPQMDLPWITFVGGPNVPPPGGVSEVETTLSPGRYAWLCFVRSPEDKKRHVMKGMIRQLIVLGPAPSTRPHRREANTITLRDHTFQLSEPLRAGRQRILVENAGSQPHEAGLWMLNPGVTEAAARAWLQHPSGPPPATPVGGVVDLSPGERSVLSIDLRPGIAILLCYSPDPKTGRSHVTMGMLQFLHVTAN